MPPKASPKVETPVDPTPKKNGGKLLLIIGLPLTAVIFSAVGFGAARFLHSENNSPMSQALRMLDRPSETENAPRNGGMPTPSRRTPEGDAFQTTYFSFDEPLTTNPQGSRRFVQLGVTLSTQYDPKVMDHVKTHQAALRSDMLVVIGSIPEEKMGQRDGREELANALRDAINERLTNLEGFGGIEGVFFPTFVLQ